MEIYKANYELVSPAHRRAFLDALPDLGLGFNELQVTKIAAACNLFPLWSDHIFPSGPHFLPHHGLEAGGFVQAICRDGEHRNWEGLERSHHVRDTDWYHGLDCYKSVAPDGAEWLTFSLPDLVQHD
ncbi:hypothetical protein BDV93DRAFT_228079 [Ceratobasidium sp. AG-I]|nr:hypothetical protein BDV93DRAFT_228079 [Ceratobasidium sp. AG-I]